MYIPSGRGFGQMSAGETAASIAGQGAALTASVLSGVSIATTVAAGGTAATATVLGISALVVPVIGAAIAGLIAIGIALANAFKGCGQTCILATQYANQVEAILKQNLQTYINSPVRTVSMQTAAVNNYNTAIAALEQACGQAQLGSAGKNCIDERVNASSCQWKASPGGWSGSCPGSYTGYGASGSGSACVNWVVLYLDPIQNDPCVQPDSVLTGGASNGSFLTSSPSASSTILGIPTPFAIGGLLLAAWLVSE